jgi:hypothetical protein
MPVFSYLHQLFNAEQSGEVNKGTQSFIECVERSCSVEFTG